MVAIARTADQVLEDLDARDLLELAKNHARTHHVPIGTMVGRDRFSDAVRARHTFWKVLHEEHGFSFSAIGRVFGVDHTTVRSALYALADTVPPPPEAA